MLNEKISEFHTITNCAYCKGFGKGMAVAANGSIVEIKCRICNGSGTVIDCIDIKKEIVKNDGI